MYAEILTLFKAFFDICRLRLGPQDLPASPFLLGITLLCYTLSSILLALITIPPLRATLSGITESLLVAALTVIVLRVRHMPARWTQTLTALAGTGMLLSLVAFPLTMWLNEIKVSDGDVRLPGLILLLLVIWNVVIMAHILRHALSTSFGIGLLLSVGYLWIIISTLNALFPVAA
ncbi:MAG: hypothetical protein L0Z68_06710 [Gammaproteobacteria bacterium]|nr:hypothetical protein [Gammaproteobacteria bacterium]